MNTTSLFFEEIKFIVPELFFVFSILTLLCVGIFLSSKYLYNNCLESLGLHSVDYKKIYKPIDYEIFIKQYYKFTKKRFGFERSKFHYFIYLFGLRILIKRRDINV